MTRREQYESFVYILNEVVESCGDDSELYYRTVMGFLNVYTHELESSDSFLDNDIEK